MSLAWKINGVPWAGAVATVGTGKNYPDLESALIDTVGHDILLLVYDGTYGQSFHLGSSANRKIAIKGMGESYADVIINGPFYSGYITGQDTLFEWCTLVGPYNNNWMLMSSDAYARVIFNKCKIQIGGGPGPNMVAGGWNRNTLQNDLDLSYCEWISNGRWDVVQYFKIDLQNWSWHRVLGHNSFIILGTPLNYGGSEFDFKYSGDLTGYGPDYGDFMIKQAKAAKANSMFLVF